MCKEKKDVMSFLILIQRAEGEGAVPLCVFLIFILRKFHSNLASDFIFDASDP